MKEELNAQAFLTNLYNEYRNVEKLVVELSNELTLITDPMQLSKLFRELFAPYLVDYMKRESDWLTERLTGHLEHYYQSQRHQKRALNVSGLAEFRRDLQAKFHITGGDRSQNDYDVSLLSEEVAVNIIEDIRRAAKRCLLDLRSQNRLVACRLYIIFRDLHNPVNHQKKVKGEMSRFGVYTTGPYGIQSVDFEADRLLNLSSGSTTLTNPSYANEISVKRNELKQDLEGKFCTGLEKCLNLAISRVQYLLSSEQRKTDFRPDINANSGIIAGNPPSLVSFLASSLFTNYSKQYLTKFSAISLSTY
ncbi:unnamed protein product [Schistosoma mattheei]|uniref:Exocyst complex component Sec10-like alpha-helical bundle domain-containing protein n=1 Tax=Schistosoma mattheei TaxID=31246 RepID=A0A183PAB1_9TREM|nr:unnamed protein product [Schistosoma mattheei]